MEKRKEKLSSLRVCRFCLNPSDNLKSLYDRSQTSKDAVNLPLKILSCIAVEVFPSDKMPCYICNRCKHFMSLFYEYKNIVRQADENVLSYVKNGSALKAITWPSSLIKAFKNFGSVKTIVEGGATVQVTSQDDDESDEEDTDVYNIKIDNFDAGQKTACIKVVSTKESQEKDDSASGDKESGGENEGMLEKQGLEDGCWACDECDCTYPLQQLLDLHKMQKHRARTLQCNECDVKCFNKYDLTTHQLRHSTEMPFKCVACDKKFKRLILLKRHEKMVHADLPQQVCPFCPATFLSIEQFETHQKRHMKGSRRYACATCDKKFNDTSSLLRHEEAVHNKNLRFQCKYCPERFGTVAKLARHVRTHAGERAYPCKYCHKSFTKSHHYTRHLRSKHQPGMAVECQEEGGADTEPESAERYRCEQCADTFSGQDDLIYHSAVHATQNLTCPLCQEKFPDVDAVTAHIKSHVNGTQYMCDFCELVYTTKEKLDIHLMTAHEEELQHELGQEESDMEMDGEEDDDCNINVKEVDDNNMIIEIKKPDNFIIKKSAEVEAEQKNDNTYSEESETEATYTELATVDTLAMLTKDSAVKQEKEKPGTPANTAGQKATPVKLDNKSNDVQKSSILRKAEEIKRKLGRETVTPPTSTPVKNVSVKVENSSGGASDKSLRLLEKELQDLKRTNSRNDASKTPLKTVETLKSRRPQLHTSTPRLRAIEEKKMQLKSTPTEKKMPEKRIVTKENKEPKEIKNGNNGNVKEDKSTKDVKEDAKNVSKTGSNDKSIEEGVRRSTRPSKIKDYAKMIQDKPQGSDMDDTEDDDEEYREPERNSESRARSRRSSMKQAARGPAPAPAPAPAASPAPAPPTRKRGRPKKTQQPEPVPAKVRKDDTEESENIMPIKKEPKDLGENSTEETNQPVGSSEEAKPPTTPEQKTAPSAEVLVSPTGQTLKKVPVKALPPGVKPLPLPMNARPIPSGDLCEMQIGKKVVKVQKIVMTRAEVEAMAKKGLVEMKDGTMVLKQGIKLPTTDNASMKLTSEEDATKESPKSQQNRDPKPSRCSLEEES